MMIDPKSERIARYAAGGDMPGATYFSPENALLVELSVALSERDFEDRWMGIEPGRSGVAREPAGMAGQAVFGALRRLGALARAGASLPIRVSNTVLLWLERYQQRRVLDSLSDHVLKDMGLSRGAVDAEVAKRFWRE